MIYGQRPVPSTQFTFSLSEMSTTNAVSVSSVCLHIATGAPFRNLSAALIFEGPCQMSVPSTNETVVLPSFSTAKAVSNSLLNRRDRSAGQGSQRSWMLVISRYNYRYVHIINYSLYCGIGCQGCYFASDLTKAHDNVAHDYIGGTISNPHYSFHDPFVFLLHSNLELQPRILV